VRIFVFESQTRQASMHSPATSPAADCPNASVPGGLSQGRRPALRCRTLFRAARSSAPSGSTGFQLWRLKDTAAAK